MHHTARTALPAAAQLRAALAEEAAHRQQAELPPGPVPARLRLLTTAELLCPAPPPRHCADLCAELEALCAAADAAVRRRSGWLDARLCTEPLPIAAPPRLIQAAVLSLWRGALLGGGQAGVLCRRAGSAAILQLWGGSAGRLARSDAALLLQKLAACTGGALLLAANGCASAVLRLPLATGLPACPAAGCEALLQDRYSLLHVYLAGFCAEA